MIGDQHVVNMLMNDKLGFGMLQDLAEQ